MGKRILSLVLTMSLGLVLSIALQSVTTKNVEATTITTITVSAEQLQDDASCGALQNALRQARDSATEQNPYKIVVEPGTYQLSTVLRIYGNTHLYMEGVTFIQKGTWGMIYVGDTNVENPPQDQSGYYYQNITLEGGVWDGQGSNKCILRAAHAKNFTVKNVTFQNMDGNHMAEVAAIDGLTVTGCTFQDQVTTSNPENIGCEALQLDILEKGHFTGYLIEELPLKNVVIQDNAFKNVVRGVGAHTAWIGLPYENVDVSGNTFTNVQNTAIASYHFKNCTIENNTMNGCGRGVEVYSIKENGNGAYNCSNPRTIYLDAKTVIQNNTMKINDDGEYRSAGVWIAGENFTKPTQGRGDRMQAGNYYVKNVTVTNNNITTEGHGIRAVDGWNIDISSNTVTGIGASDLNNGVSATKASRNISINNNTVTGFSANGIAVDTASTAASIQNNKINKSGTSGIFISASTVADVKNNTITSPVKRGLHLYSAAKVDDITNNTITTAGEHGIFLDKSTASNVYKNTITSPAKNGIYLSNSSKITLAISTNNIKNAKGVGLYVGTKATAADIKNNTISKPKKRGIHISDASVTRGITANKITAPGEYGISADKSIVKNITNNTITAASLKGVALSGSTKCSVISGNTISESKSNGIYVSGLKQAMTIKTNKLSGNKDHAIYLNGSTKYLVTILGNSIKAVSKKNGIQIKIGYVSINSNIVSGSLWPINLEAGVKGSVGSSNTLKSNSNNKARLRGTKATITLKGLNKPSSVKTQKKSSTSIKISWKKVTGATKYQVYRSTAKSGTYTKVATISGNRNVSWTNKKLKKKKTYYYKVRAVATNSKVKSQMYGNFSSVAARKL